MISYNQNITGLGDGVLHPLTGGARGRERKKAFDDLIADEDENKK